MPPRILVAGAGIAGLTAALALGRGGFAVTLAEKRSRFEEAGAGIQISPNAGRVLEALDLALPLKRAALPVERLVVRGWRGERPIAAMPMSVPGETPFRVLKRADLHLLLLDAVRALPNVRLAIGRGLAAIRQENDRVVAELRSETGAGEEIEAAAVVGADGLWSATARLAGLAGPERFTGFEAWRATAPVTGAARPEIALRLGRGRHAVSYPVGRDGETNLVVVSTAAEAAPGWSQEGDPARLRAILAGCAPDLAALAAAAPGWRRWSLYDRAAAPMSAGRVALIGDAAHPILPFLAQGAGLAIEDAAVLARLLEEAVRDGGEAAIPASLERFAALRGPRAARVAQASRRNGRAYHMGWPGSVARDLVMRRIGPGGMRARFDWLYDWRDG